MNAGECPREVRCGKRNQMIGLKEPKIQKDCLIRMT